MSFRAIVKTEVDRQGLSGYRLAKLSDTPMRTVQAYLSGERDLTGERLAKLCKALGLELRPRKQARRKGR